MKAAEQRRAAGAFAERWAGKIAEEQEKGPHGDERKFSQPFWLDLLGSVYGADDPAGMIRFEDKVLMDHASFIDGIIPDTRVLIEQKASTVDLDASIPQSNGMNLTPFQQAKRYIPELPVDEHPRWVVTSNFREFRVYDMNHPSSPPELIQLADLERDFHRLQFLVDAKDPHIRRETAVSEEAGEIVGIIHEALSEQYADLTNPASLHALNVLCVRLVFCLYAESAGIFGRHGMFTQYMNNHQKDARRALMDLFSVLDTPEEERDSYLDDDLAEFPYVNGGLFRIAIEIPRITPEIVYEITHSTPEKFEWRDISPTIFGAIFESTLNPETRRRGGMHYTSVENIHKALDALFLDDLQAELDDIVGVYKKEWDTAMKHNDRGQARRKQASLNHKIKALNAFRDKLASLTFLDPACGSGNFLTEAYISLRQLENDAIDAAADMQANLGGAGSASPIRVSIEQFYGIEINDFAATVAQTALWIAEAQMLQKTEKIIGTSIDFLPLRTSAHITTGNALRMDWKDIVPPDRLDYIIGNPPFGGARVMTEAQKKDVLDTFGAGWKNAGNLDYVTCWFKKAADYMQGTPVRAALVATNSVCQGESVGTLWEPLFHDGVRVDFGWQTFRWDSKAKNKARVHVVIVGFSTPGAELRIPVLYSSEASNTADGVQAEHINGYLVDGPNIAVGTRQRPLSDVPRIGIGNKPIDGGHYLFTGAEKDAFVEREPASAPFFRPWYGSVEFIHRKPRWCLWLGDCTPDQIAKMPHCKKRVQAVREYRLASKSPGTRKLADRPTRFHVENMPKGNYIVIPQVSSKRRNYIPIGYMSDDVLCGDKVRIMPDGSLYHFGVMESSVHMAWMRLTSCRLKSDYSYSNTIVYNNFPWPDPTPEQKAKIEQTAQAILDARALYPNASLADLYDDATMPPELRKAHEANDRAVMKAYGFNANETETEITTRLLHLYASMAAEAEKCRWSCP